MTMHLVRRNTRSVLWASKEALAPTGEQDSTGHDICLRASKSSSPAEDPDNRILSGAKGFGDPGPFHIGPMVHVEKEVMSKDEQREYRLLGYTAEDNPVLSKPKSRKGKAPRCQGQSP